MQEFPSSHGFVEVGEGENNGFYTLLKRRCTSVDDMTRSNETLYSLYRNLLREFRVLESEVSILKRKVKVNDRWEIRYSKRIAVMSNLALGIWIFWSNFLHRVKQRKAKIIRMVMGKQPESSALQTFLSEAYGAGLQSAWVFVFFAFMLTRPLAWARWTGVALSSLYSLYLASYVRFLPWPNYCNFFTSLLYIAATIKENPQTKRIPNLEEFLKQNELKVTGTFKAPAEYSHKKKITGSSNSSTLSTSPRSSYAPSPPPTLEGEAGDAEGESSTTYSVVPSSPPKALAHPVPKRYHSLPMPIRDAAKAHNGMSNSWSTGIQANREVFGVPTETEREMYMPVRPLSTSRIIMEENLYANGESLPDDHDEVLWKTES